MQALNSKEMKRHFTMSAVAAMVAVSCTNLEEEIYSQIPKDTFLSDDANVALYTSRPYTALQSWGSEQSMLTLIFQLSNEAAIPRAYNGSWAESRYSELQRHSIPAGNKLVRCGWDFCFDGIAACNDAIYELQRVKEQTDLVLKSTAEIKVLRAYYYLLAVDCWGNVPFSIDKTQTSYPEQKDRKFLLKFIEDEIKENIDILDENVSSLTYGRVTKGVAQFLLAKIYLNSEEWTGVARYEEAEKICSDIMTGGQYKLASTYSANFAINNENGPEAIFAIPHSSVYTNYAFYIYVMTFNDDLQKAFNIGDTWNGSLIAQPDFFDSYEPGDTRKSDTWLFGQVYNPDGTKYQYKEVAIDASGNQSTVMKDYVLSGSPIDEGKYVTGIGRFEGARIIKWPYQTDGTLSSYRISMENDFYLMRYSDVVLMYVEALVRQGKTVEAAAVSEFVRIRERAGLAPMSASELTHDNLLLERQHELALEGWSRQDLIRFGKYTKSWWAKPEGEDYMKLLPIPDLRMGDNPNLIQNNGYNK